MAPRKRMEKLRNLGLTPTIQRVAVLEYLEGTRSHPTADQVLAVLREKYPSVSRATIYNTLEALTKAGAILKLSFDAPAARYDADTNPHGHFQCRVCGKLEDIELPEIAGLKGLAHGRRVETVRLYAYGVCASCQGTDVTAASPAAEQKERRVSSGRPVPKQDTEKTDPPSLPGRRDASEGGE
jgi:Fur family peroxide stress response transcriptional regulator